eukprot:gb/GECG01001304.1/.p1 GENE.gb/GECG01001304.1/~~gb/GECG01001304.1/.p1  ORF type:complete len:898 (+),score=151.57 gb/GECG01001304.1/:1-2694(+)
MEETDASRALKGLSQGAIEANKASQEPTTASIENHKASPNCIDEEEEEDDDLSNLLALVDDDEEDENDPPRNLDTSNVADPSKQHSSSDAGKSHDQEATSGSKSHSLSTSSNARVDQGSPKKKKAAASTSLMKAKRGFKEVAKPLTYRPLSTRSDSHSSEVSETEKQKKALERREQRKRASATPLAGEKTPNWDSVSVRKKQKLASEERMGDDIEKFSRIRLRQRVLPREEMKSMLSEMKFISLDSLSKFSQHKVKEVCEQTQWATIGIVSDRSYPKSSSNGKKYSILTITDFSKRISLFIFDEAFESHKTKRSGSVVLICNPKVIPASNTSSSFSISISTRDSILQIGEAADFGRCRGHCKNGNKCTMPVNINKASFCEFHFVSEFKKVGTRGGFNTADSAGLVKPGGKKGLRNISEGSYSYRSFQSADGAGLYFAPQASQQTSSSKSNPSIREKALRNKGITTGVCKPGGFRGAYGYQPNAVSTGGYQSSRSSSRKTVMKIDGEGGAIPAAEAHTVSSEKQKKRSKEANTLGKSIEEASHGGKGAHQLTRGGIYLSKAVGYNPSTKDEMHKKARQEFDQHRKTLQSSDPLKEALQLARSEGTSSSASLQKQPSSTRRSEDDHSQESRDLRKSLSDSGESVPRMRYRASEQASSRAGEMAGVHNKMSASGEYQRKVMARHSSQVTAENIRMRGLYGNPENQKNLVEAARARIKQKNINAATKALKHSGAETSAPKQRSTAKRNAVEQALKLRSRHEKEVSEDAQEEVLDKLGRHETAEEMRKKAAEICGQSIKVTVWQCLDCNNGLKRSKPTICEEEGHFIEHSKRDLYFFSCSNCHNRTTEFTPKSFKACSKCGHRLWEAAPPMKQAGDCSKSKELKESEEFYTTAPEIKSLRYS